MIPRCPKCGREYMAAHVNTNTGVFREVRGIRMETSNVEYTCYCGHVEIRDCEEENQRMKRERNLV